VIYFLPNILDDGHRAYAQAWVFFVGFLSANRGYWRRVRSADPYTWALSRGGAGLRHVGAGRGDIISKEMLGACGGVRGGLIMFSTLGAQF
jgi:hypothetical protein